MNTIAEMNKNVGRLVTDHAYSAPTASDHLDELEEAINKIDSMPLHVLSMGAEEAAKSKSRAFEKAVSFYLSQRLSTRYPRVSPELLNRKRWIQLHARRGQGWEIAGETLDPPQERTVRTKDDDGKILLVHYVEVPLLLLSGHVDRLFRTSISGFGDYLIRARPPIVPEAARACEIEATADILECYADALRVPQISTLVSGLITSRRGGSIDVPTAKVAWVPLLSELKLESVPPDPALLLEFHGYTHLVTHWDAPGERPIEAILREYTEGRFSK